MRATVPRATEPAPHRTARLPARARRLELARRAPALLLGLALAVLMAPAPAAAQVSVFINTGATLPTGDYGEFHTLSYSGAAAFDVTLSERLAVGARAEYHRAGLDGGALLQDLGLGGLPLAAEGGASLVFVMPVVRVFQRVENAEFYALGGVGYARATEEDVVVFGRDTSERFQGGRSDAVGAQLAVGARLPAGPFAIFGEVGYLAAFTDPATTALPVRFGVAYTFGWDP